VEADHRGLLGDVLAAMVSEASLPELLQRCAEALVKRLDMAFARVWLLDDAGETLELQASAGLYTHLDGTHARVPVGAYKIGWIAEHRIPHLTNDVPGDPRVGDPDWARREAMVAFAGYPLLVGDQLVGVLGMFARHELSPATLEALASVADSLALGVCRKRAEEDLRDERHIIDLLHRVGTTLASQLDVGPVLQSVTDTATDLSGAGLGAFFYNVDDDGGESYRLYTLSGVPRSSFGDLPMPRNTAIFGPTFEGAGPVRLDDVTADARYGHSAPYFGMPEGHPPLRSYLAVPVVARNGEVLGGLFLGHPDAGVFTERAERIVVGIVGHAAIAIENARLYERERSAALTLQRSLLPGSLPEGPGYRLTAAYLPASHHAEIGGDWYDAHALGDGRLIVTVGDIGGHDLRAAAVMGQVRTAVRMSALENAEPADVLLRADRFLALSGAGEFATAVQATYEPATGLFTVASAGHPPPLLVPRDGPAVFLDVDPMPALGNGLLDEVAGESNQTVFGLDPGSTVVLFTDGLVERRDRSVERGMESLRAAATAGQDLDPDALCDHLLEQVVGSSPQHDDIVVVLLTIDADVVR